MIENARQSDQTVIEGYTGWYTLRPLPVKRRIWMIPVLVFALGREVHVNSLDSPLGG